jgi:hypothetical protein
MCSNVILAKITSVLGMKYSEGGFHQIWVSLIHTIFAMVVPIPREQDIALHITIASLIMMHTWLRYFGWLD